MRILSLILSFVFLCSCQTIRFVKNDQVLSEADRDKVGTFSTMQHIGLFGFDEYSQPTSVEYICGSDDNLIFVETYTGFKQWLINIIGGWLTAGILTSLYSPHSVDIVCFREDRDALINTKSNL